MLCICFGHGFVLTSYTVERNMLEQTRREKLSNLRLHARIFDLVIEGPVVALFRLWQRSKLAKFLNLKNL